MSFDNNILIGTEDGINNLSKKERRNICIQSALLKKSNTLPNLKSDILIDLNDEQVIVYFNFKEGVKIRGARNWHLQNDFFFDMLTFQAKIIRQKSRNS